MSPVASETSLTIVEHAPIATWFGVGGGARRLATPGTHEQVRECVELDPSLRVLGDGANLLIDDQGVPELVLDTGELNAVRWDERTGAVLAQAGASLPALIIEAVRRGLGGVEGLAGIPASVGGAAIMNASGAFGEFADTVSCVHAIDRDGRDVVLGRGEIDFGYRHSGLNHLIVTSVELRLTPEDPLVLRERLKETMAYKKRTQPMAADSAGCVFKNPTLHQPIKSVGDTGQRVSAGLLIDRAGCRGLHVGGAEVSHRHANFIITHEHARARDVIELMDMVAQRVLDAFGVTLAPEVVLWRRQQ